MFFNLLNSQEVITIIAYIRKNDRKYCGKLNKLFYNYIQWIYGIVIEKINNGIIILVPIDTKNIEKIKKRIADVIKENKIEYIVCENNLERYVINKEKILNGKIIMKYLVLEIYKYIYNIKKENILLDDIHILINAYNKENLELIKGFTKLSRNVNIITENLNAFLKLEKTLEKENIVITVSNNKRKSLRLAKNIINVDFSEQTLKDYCINSYAIIINLTNSKLNILTGFNGIIINNFEIIEDENFKKYIDEFYGNINLKIFFEANIMYKIETLDIEKIKIDGVAGIHGKIANAEIIQLSNQWLVKK